MSHGVFCAPSYFFRDEGFRGQERLDMLDATIALALNKPAILPTLKVAS
ncbi:MULTISPECIES: hypothetical protein [unclassified Xanthobacter]|nr:MULTISPECIES: hypothetical protein [unclassified Xanthobacter]